MKGGSKLPPAMMVITLVLRVLLGATLVVTGALKVGHAAELASAIAGFRLLPPELIGPMSVALPYFELLVGGYLIIGLFTRVTALVAAAQFAVYAGAIASAVLRGIPANCGCFGPHDTATADWPHVAFDIALAAVAAVIAAGAPGMFALDRRIKTS